MKRYENLIEKAFEYVEQIQSGTPVPEGPQLADKAYDNLKEAVDALKPFRAAGEQIFVLRAHDRVAPRAIMAWGRFLSSDTGLQTPWEEAARKADRMLEWQEKHPDLVKMPD